MATNGNENCTTSAEYLVVKYVTLDAVKRDYNRHILTSNYIKLHQITSNYIKLHQITSNSNENCAKSAIILK